MNEDPSFSENLIYSIKRSETKIGNDRYAVDIHLSGALIAPLHAKITRSGDSDEEAVISLEVCSDANYLTYVNGEVLSSSKILSHVIFLNL